MIQINLIPDVKQELIRAQKFRNIVISASIIAAIGFAGVVVLLSLYVFGVQALIGKTADNTITKEFGKLKGVTDLDKALTLQNQLKVTSDDHNLVTMNSRVFDMLATVVPSAGSQVTVTNFTVDADNKTISIDGSAPSGYQALDAFKKTILATKFQYQTAGNTDLEKVALTDQVSDGERSYTEDSEGKNILKFTISFVYNDALLARNSTNGKFITPSTTNATDSINEVPSSIFSSSEGAR